MDNRKYRMKTSEIQPYRYVEKFRRRQRIIICMSGVLVRYSSQGFSNRSDRRDVVLFDSTIQRAKHVYHQILIMDEVHGDVVNVLNQGFGMGLQGRCCSRLARLYR